jgi:DnaJ-like protein
MPEDPRRDALRYQVDKLAAELGMSGEGAEQDERERQKPAASTGPARSGPTMQERAWMVETAIEQAIRRGEFDDLPGSGKPLTGLTGVHDPDWWIRRKIEREQLTGLGPPALTLRTENATLIERIDALHREDDVRSLLEDFNKRVIEARRQLQGGPPVVTPTRDVEFEISGWRGRRTARHEAAAAARRAEEDRLASMTWRERRQERRERRKG